jgi:N-acetylglucosaminyl-diphospho-decaprenol L-rhamnosyltransferase
VSGAGDVAVVYVAYRTDRIDTSWIDDRAEVLVVRNDARPPSVDHARARFVGDGTNVGFGAGVNVAASETTATRLVLCNPDVQLAPAHFDALASGSPDEIVTVPLVDGHGHPTPVVNPYPGAFDHLLTGLRVGRVLPLGSRRRRWLARLSPTATAQEAVTSPGGTTWSTSTHWCSGAVLSVDAGRFADAGGFDPAYFLYLEDLDLCARLAAARVPRIRVADAAPGRHAVGGSGEGAATAAHRLDSAITYAGRQQGRSWRAVEQVLRARRRLRTGRRG